MRINKECVDVVQNSYKTYMANMVYGGQLIAASALDCCAACVSKYSDQMATLRKDCSLFSVMTKTYQQNLHIS